MGWLGRLSPRRRIFAAGVAAAVGPKTLPRDSTPAPLPCGTVILVFGPGPAAAWAPATPDRKVAAADTAAATLSAVPVRENFNELLPPWSCRPGHPHRVPAVTPRGCVAPLFPLWIKRSRGG